MSAMLQDLAKGEFPWCLPTGPLQYQVQREVPEDADSNRDQDFIDFLAAYRDSGGLARTHELIGMFKRGDGGDTERLARWIVTRQVISIEWQDQTWFPWFQFDRDLGRPQSTVGQIIRELCSTLDDWEIARWFVQPNPWLDNGTPAENLKNRPADLLEAARASRFLAKG